MIDDDHKAIIDRYVNDRCHVGSGFQSLIIGSPNIHRLDVRVRANLANILLYIVDNVPAKARGSRDNYKNWCGTIE